MQHVIDVVLTVAVLFLFVRVMILDRRRAK